MDKEVLHLGLTIALALWSVRLFIKLSKAQIQRARDKHEILTLKKHLHEAECVVDLLDEEVEGHVTVVAMLMREIEWMGPRAPRALPAPARHPEIVQGRVVPERRVKIRAPKKVAK